MTVTTALVANVILDLAAAAPIYLLARWAIRRDRQQVAYVRS
jgi:hypothetical protein